MSPRNYMTLKQALWYLSEIDEFTVEFIGLDQYRLDSIIMSPQEIIELATIRCVDLGLHNCPEGFE